jgi:DnaJ like chaperone protein
LSVESPFQRAYLRSGNKVRLGSLTLLAWIAASDGSISDDEDDLLREIAGPRQDEGEFYLALEVGRRASVGDLQLACEMMRQLALEHKRTFLQLAVRVAIADQRLAIPENHLLRFLADLTGVNLDGVYREITAESLPFPGDPSSINWWEMRERAEERASKESRTAEKSGSQDASKSKAKMSRLEAFAVLGLEDDASADEIASAFRRLASIHHPDRFGELGPEAERAAAKTFARIRAAYETVEPK